jgi:pyridoxal phosphate enzyme (YggS family)
MKIAETLKTVLEKMNKAAIKAGRNSDNIELVAVSKTVELKRIVEAIQAGISILGENRVQEAKNKITELRTCLPDRQACLPDRQAQISDINLEWHLIGNLQKNKAKAAVQLFDLIHSLDSASLAEVLNNQSQRIGKRQRVLVQVKLLNELSKHGVLERNLMELLEKVSNMENLRLEGLMLMPPFFEDPEKARPYFRKLRQLADEASAKGFPVNAISMGMSNDFEVAIEEGATMVRIGTAIFGERPFHR